MDGGYWEVVQPFRPTHILYNPGDTLSYWCAFLSLIPQTLGICYAILIWSSREWEILFMFMGQITSELINIVLKRTIRQARPSHFSVYNGYGMPSSHAQFSAFFSVYLLLFINYTYNSRESRKFERIFLSVCFISLATLIGISRVYLMYHSLLQVVMGWVVGGAIGVLWYSLTCYTRKSNWSKWIINSRIMKYFRFRDLLPSQDLPSAGWEQWRREVEVKLE